MTTPRLASAATESKALVTRRQKIGWRLACLTRHRARGSLLPESCSFYWSGVARELHETSEPPTATI